MPHPTYLLVIVKMMDKSDELPFGGTYKFNWSSRIFLSVVTIDEIDRQEEVKLPSKQVENKSSGRRESASTGDATAPFSSIELHPTETGKASSEPAVQYSRNNQQECGLGLEQEALQSQVSARKLGSFEFVGPVECKASNSPSIEQIHDSELVDFVSQSMSDDVTLANNPLDSNPNSTPTNGHRQWVRVFQKANVLSACSSVFSDSDKKPRFRGLLRQVLQFKGYRCQLNPSDSLLMKLHVLKADFPNFAAVIDHYIDELVLWRVVPPHSRIIWPVLLNGPPGTGKTAFAKALAGILNTGFVFHNMGAISASFVLKGGSSQWSSSKEGLLLKHFAESKEANPVVLLDEIDKQQMDQRYPIEPILLELLESATAQQFTDEFAELTFNASYAIYICTSNNIKLVSKPMLSRMEVFQIEPPKGEQLIDVARSVAKSLYPQLIFEEELLAFATYKMPNLRELQRRIKRLVAAYARDVDNDSASCHPPGDIGLCHIRRS